MVYDFMIKTLVVANCTSYWNLSYPSVRAAQAFILRSTFAHPSLKVRSSFVTYSAAPARRLSFAEGSLQV